MLKAISVLPERDEDGAVAIVTAVCAIVLFLVAALVVDLGLARDVRRQSQNAADASALAAANVVYPISGGCLNGSAPPCLDDAVNAATTYAAENFQVSAGAWGSCVDPEHLYVAPGSSNCISFTDDTESGARPSQPTKVRVVIPTRDVPTGLGALAGVDSVAVSSLAEADLSNSIDLTCTFCFLGDVDSGNADYSASGGSIAVNGNVSLGANGNMTATDGGSVGIAGTFSPSAGFSPKPVTSISHFTDPLAGLALPDGKAGLTTWTGSPCSTGPGVYGDFAVSGTCTLPSGLYIITGTWSLKNKDLLTNAAGGVTLYFTCGTPSAPTACADTGAAGGQLYGKNGDLNLTARTSGPITGYTVVYDRNNTSSVQLQGNGQGTLTGGLYAKRAALEYNGNSCFTINRGPVVVDSVIKANGNKSCVNVLGASNATYDSTPGTISLSR